jgi:hypothetical protein
MKKGIYAVALGIGLVGILCILNKDSFTTLIEESSSLAAVTVAKPQTFSATGVCAGGVSLVWEALPVSGYQIQRQQGSKYVTVATIPEAGVSSSAITSRVHIDTLKAGVASGKYRMRAYVTYLDKTKKMVTKFGAFSPVKTATVLPATTPGCRPTILPTQIADSDITITQKTGGVCGAMEVIVTRPAGASADLVSYRWEDPTSNVIQYGRFGSPTAFYLSPGTHSLKFVSIGQDKGETIISPVTYKKVEVVGGAECPPAPVIVDPVVEEPAVRWSKVTSNYVLKGVAWKAVSKDGKDITADLISDSNDDKEQVIAVYADNQNAEMDLAIVAKASEYVYLDENGKEAITVIDPALDFGTTRDKEQQISDSVVMNIPEGVSPVPEIVESTPSFSVCLEDVGCSPYGQVVGSLRHFIAQLWKKIAAAAEPAPYIPQRANTGDPGYWIIHPDSEASPSIQWMRLNFWKKTPDGIWVCTLFYKIKSGYWSRYIYKVHDFACPTKGAPLTRLHVEIFKQEGLIQREHTLGIWINEKKSLFIITAAPQK